MIPTTSPSVNVRDLHPTLKLRVEAMLADQRMKGYKVVSGVRTYAQQKYLYQGWISGKKGFNLAANPDAYGAATFDGFRFRGSHHMQQDDGFGYAVDLRAPFWHSTKKRWALVGAVGAEYGLRQVVRTEWWHLEHRDRTHIFDAPRIAKPIVQPEFPQEDLEMQLINDTNQRRMFAAWVTDGTQHVDEYGSYLAGAGVPMPNISYVIDDQVAKGNIRKVG
jgi:hypothetical protein